MTLRTAIVTPYFAEATDILRQMRDSVRAQTHPCRHFLVGDGRRHPAVDAWDVDHIVLETNHADFGSSPRYAGAQRAIDQGYELIAFLDADNWLREDHVELLADLHASTGAAFLSCGRVLCRLDGSVLGSCPFTDPDRFVDTSCMAFSTAAFGLLPYWVAMPAFAMPVNDRAMLSHVIASGLPRAHTPEETVFYRCGKPGIYRLFGEEPAPGVVPAPDYQGIFSRWAAEGRPPLL